MPYIPKPPDQALEILTQAAQTILWKADAEAIYLYGSAGRYFNKIDDSGTRTLGSKGKSTRGRQFSGTSDFDIGIKSSNKENTLRLLSNLVSEGKLPRSIKSYQSPKGDVRNVGNKGYWPPSHKISYAVHLEELQGRFQDRYILAE